MVVIRINCCFATKHSKSPKKTVTHSAISPQQLESRPVTSVHILWTKIPKDQAKRFYVALSVGVVSHLSAVGMYVRSTNAVLYGVLYEVKALRARRRGVVPRLVIISSR